VELVWPKNAKQSFASRRRLKSMTSKSECSNEVTALRPMYPGCIREMPSRRPAIRSPMCSDRSSIFTIRDIGFGPLCEMGAPLVDRLAISRGFLSRTPFASVWGQSQHRAKPPHWIRAPWAFGRSSRKGTARIPSATLLDTRNQLLGIVNFSTLDDAIDAPRIADIQQRVSIYDHYIGEFTGLNRA
jgi:hypothetical protein